MDSGYYFCFLMRGLAKQSRHIMNTILSGESFSVISFQDKPSGTKVESGVKLHSVKRTVDGEVFTIGDLVTNELKMKGTITGFNILEGELFVSHTWSGVGMNLNSLSKIIELPSQHQIGNEVWLTLWSSPIASEIHAVHFYEGKVKYDLIVFGGNGDQTRLYNVDSVFVVKQIPVGSSNP